MIKELSTAAEVTQISHKINVILSTPIICE